MYVYMMLLCAKPEAGGNVSPSCFKENILYCTFSYLFMMFVPACWNLLVFSVFQVIEVSNGMYDMFLF